MMSVSLCGWREGEERRWAGRGGEEREGKRRRGERRRKDERLPRKHYRYSQPRGKTQGNTVGTLNLEGRHNSIQMKSPCRMLEKPLRTWTDFIYCIISSKPHTETKCITHKNQLHFRDNCHLETAPNVPTTSSVLCGLHSSAK